MRRRVVSTSSTSVCIPIQPTAGPPIASQSSVTAAASGALPRPVGEEEGSWWTGGAAGALPPTEEGSTVYARSTTIQAQPRRIDMGIAHLRDVVMPALRQIDGCVGIVAVGRPWVGPVHCDQLVGDRSRRCRPAPSRCGRCATGPRGLRRQRRSSTSGRSRCCTATTAPAAGACVRATWLTVRPDQFERAIEFYRESVLPAVEEFDGFCSASLLLDRTLVACRGVVDVRQRGRDAAQR